MASHSAAVIRIQRHPANGCVGIFLLGISFAIAVYPMFAPRQSAHQRLRSGTSKTRRLSALDRKAANRSL
jgi:hypothetical protein